MPQNLLFGKPHHFHNAAMNLCLEMQRRIQITNSKHGWNMLKPYTLKKTNQQYFIIAAFEQGYIPIV